MTLAHQMMEEGWDKYMEHVYPDGAPAECVRQTKQAYYAGAMVALIGLDLIANTMDSPEAEQKCKEMMDAVSEVLRDNWSTAKPK